MPGTMSGKTETVKSTLGGAAAVSAVLLAAVLVAGCSSQARHSAKPKPTEYFAESEYGVKASPRVTSKRSRLPRGGGRDQVGKAYKVKGTWYHPQEVASYSKVGKASWYGDAFHGRLTANGEIYDMTHLTAAHPTLPLPSYARVTNLKNGNSVVVRINDRGPFAHGRIIDLSKRAAEMLDYTRSGVAEVKVDYMGRAPLHGQDDEFLLASYRPGGAPASADSVLVAMNGTTPDNPFRSIPDIIAESQGAELPEFGPVLTSSPLGSDGLALSTRMGTGSAYAAERNLSGAGAALERLAAVRLTPEAIIEAWNRRGGAGGEEVSVHLGTFEDADMVRSLVQAFGPYGGVPGVEHDGEADAYTVTMRIDAGMEADLLRRAWSLGATDAFLTRP